MSTIQPGGLTAHAVTELPNSTLANDTVTFEEGRAFTGFASMHVELPDGATAENKLFYWFFRSQSSEIDPADTEPIPLVIWLNGGPGSSSLAGLFLENGPVEVQSDAAVSIAPNAFSWDQRCHVLYWDQPVGTGFSTCSAGTAGYVTDEGELARQFCTALDLFFQHFDSYRSCPFYITGESYAGKYIPSITAELVVHGDRYPHVPPPDGMAIGDGWMIPGWQTKIQVEYGYAMGFVDTGQYQDLIERCHHLQQLIDAGDLIEANKVGLKITNDLVTWGGTPNIYDVRTFKQTSTTALGSYLNTPAVQHAIGVDTPWVTADDEGPVPSALAADIYLSGLDNIVSLLRHAKYTSFRVLFYTGDFDMSCGFLGTERMLYDLNYPVLDDGGDAKPDWQGLDRQLWVDGDGPPIGYVKGLGNLTQVTVIGAGHLVPMERPRSSREMIYTWLFRHRFPTRVPAIPH